MRNSNFELLRIVCMLLIVLSHIDTQHRGEMNFQSLDYLVDFIVLHFACVAVNSFVLISGYWGIHFKFQKLLKLNTQTLFYSLAIFLFTLWLGWHSFSFTKDIGVFLPIFSKQYWFITVYYTLDNVITAFVALPLFYIASTIKQKGLLSQVINKKQLIILFILFFTVWALTFQENIDYESIHLGKNFIFLYLSALGGIGCVWCIAYVVKRMFYISYVGRYSLIALGTHYPLILLFKLMGIDNKYLIASCVLLVLPGIIWGFKRYFSYFTAQKDLFVYENGKLKLHLNRKN